MGCQMIKTMNIISYHSKTCIRTCNLTINSTVTYNCTITYDLGITLLRALVSAFFFI